MRRRGGVEANAKYTNEKVKEKGVLRVVVDVTSVQESN